MEDKLADLLGKELKKMIDDAPQECLISGLKRCDYLICNEDEEAVVVYTSTPAYDAYTMYEYNREDLTFTRYHYDLDEDCWKDVEYLDLSDILNHPRIKEIIEFYKINIAELIEASI